MNKVKIGLFGVGHLGKIHLDCLEGTPFEIVGAYDPEIEVRNWLSSHTHIKVFDSPSALIEEVDAVDIVSTTISHHKVALEAIMKGKHAFIEKPLSTSIEEATEILEASQKYGVKVQVGHVERYNPAIIALKGRLHQPRFIEGHRLTTFNTRGNDVSVMMDLMIHDLDLVLDMVDSEVRDIQANGVCVVNDTPDICNARITFANGCVANLTASRISMKNMRKLRLFQPNEYVSIDFLTKQSQVISILPLGDKDACDYMTIDTSAGKKIVQVESPDSIQVNAIQEELKDFYNSIVNNEHVSVGVEAALKAIDLAQKIERLIL